MKKLQTIWGKAVVCLLGVWMIGQGVSVASSATTQPQRGLKIEVEGRGHENSITNAKGEQVLLYQNSYALLIGISDYTNGWPDLPGVKKDIDEVKKALEAQGFQTDVKMDLDKTELDQAFSIFINQYGNEPDNRLLFYFAGHGHTVKTTYGEELGYIVPRDAPNPNENQAGFQSQAMEMQQIEIYAKRIQSKHALFLFDACFSGSLFSITRAIPEVITDKTSKPVRQFITSGSADETVPDESVFRAQFIIAIQGEADANDDGYITGTELGLFLEQAVVNYSKNTQHPQYGKIRNPNLDKGDFVFVIRVEPVTEPTPTPNIPTKKFVLDDLKVKAAWEKRLWEMENGFTDIRNYEEQTSSKDLNREAWERYLEAFAEENPYSTRDNELLALANERLAYWEAYTPEPTPVPMKSLKPEPVPTPTTPPLPTPLPVPEITLAFQEIIVQNASGIRLDPVNDIYFVRQGETVTITVQVETSDGDRVQAAWTTGRGKVPLSNSRTNTYTAARLGSDYVKVLVWDALSGKELPEIPINIAVIPEDMPDSLFRIDGLVMRDQKGEEVFPEHDIYSVKVGQTVRITLNVTNLRGYNVKYAWTTGNGKVPPSATETTTYQATKIGSDYAIVYVWDSESGLEFPEVPINIQVIP